MPAIADARLSGVLAAKDLYAELGVCPSTRLADLQSAYRRAALKAHPDKGGSAAAFQAITVAFEVLSCPRARDLYDLQREKKHHLGSSPVTKADAAPEKSGVKRAAPKPAASQKGRRTKSDSAPCKRALLRAAKAAKEASRCRTAMTRMACILRAVRQVSSTRLRQMLEGLQPVLKAALLTHMKTQAAEPAATAEEPSKTPSATPSEGFHWGTSIRTIKHAQAPRYQPQLRMRHLRLQTRVQPDMETALHHQTGLIHASNAVTAAGVGVWEDTDRFCKIFEAGLLETGLALDSLDLRVYIFMRADEMFSRPAVITSPVMSLASALEVHARLARARRESWEQLRATWVPLMRSTQRAKRTALSDSEACAIANRARLSLLERRFTRAARVAERSIVTTQSRRRMAGDDMRGAQIDGRSRGRQDRTVRHRPGEGKGHTHNGMPASFGGG